MARQLSLAQLPKRGRPPRHQYVNRLAASQSSQRGTLRKGQPPLLCTGSRHSATPEYTARRFLWYKMMAKPIITEFSERHPGIAQNASFSRKIGTFRPSFIQTARRSFVTNDGPIIPWCSGRLGLCAFSGLFRGLELVPSKWRCLVPPTSG